MLDGFAVPSMVNAYFEASANDVMHSSNFLNHRLPTQSNLDCFPCWNHEAPTVRYLSVFFLLYCYISSFD